MVFHFLWQILGIDSEFCIVESFITGVVDNWPELLRPHRKKFTVAICCLMFLLGLPMVTNVSIAPRFLKFLFERGNYFENSVSFQGGVYIFQLMDFYSASGMSILWVCFFQTIAISWIFGAKKFCDCIHQMMGVRLNKFWYICWVLFAPVIMAVSIVFVSRRKICKTWKILLFRTGREAKIEFSRTNIERFEKTWRMIVNFSCSVYEEQPNRSDSNLLEGGWQGYLSRRPRAISILRLTISSQHCKRISIRSIRERKLIK